MDEQPGVSRNFWRGVVFMIPVGIACWVGIILLLRWIF